MHKQRKMERNPYYYGKHSADKPACILGDRNLEMLSSLVKRKDSQSWVKSLDLPRAITHLWLIVSLCWWSWRQTRGPCAAGHISWQRKRLPCNIFNWCLVSRVGWCYTGKIDRLDCPSRIWDVTKQARSNVYGWIILIQAPLFVCKIFILMPDLKTVEIIPNCLKERVRNVLKCLKNQRMTLA